MGHMRHWCSGIPVYQSICPACTIQRIRRRPGLRLLSQRSLQHIYPHCSLSHIGTRNRNERKGQLRRWEKYISIQRKRIYSHDQARWPHVPGRLFQWERNPGCIHRHNHRLWQKRTNLFVLGRQKTISASHILLYSHRSMDKQPRLYQ